MCGRFSQAEFKEQLAVDFGIPDVTAVPSLPPRFNIPPSRPAYVVGYNPAAHRRGLAVMSWGVVPRWWKRSLKEATRPFNATAEGIADKPTFRDSFRSRRCLVPASGFFEWNKRGGRKAPHCFRPTDAETFAFAGVWDFWPPEKLHSFAIVTTTPNAVVEPLHDRMPVILPVEAWDTWLTPTTPIDVVRSLMVPLPADAVRSFPANQLVNSPKNDEPELLLPA